MDVKTGRYEGSSNLTQALREIDKGRKVRMKRGEVRESDGDLSEKAEGRGREGYRKIKANRLRDETHRN